MSRNPFDDPSVKALFFPTRRKGIEHAEHGGDETKRFPDLTFSPLAGDLQAVGKKTEQPNIERRDIHMAAKKKAAAKKTAAKKPAAKKAAAKKKK